MDKFVEFWNSTLEFEVWQAILCSFIMLGAAFLATFGNWYISKASIREVCYSRMKEKAFQKYFQQQGKLDRILLLQLLWDVPDKAFYAFCWVGWNLLSLAAFPAAVVGAIAFSICQCGWGMALMEIGIITGMAPALLMLIPNLIYNPRERARYSFRKKK